MGVTMEYFGILAQTWKVLWKEKVILVFGLLAMLVPGLMGLLMGGFMVYLAFDNFNQFESMMGNETWFVLAWIGFLGVFMLLSFVSTGLGWAGVFKGTVEAEKGKQKITFSELWRDSFPYFGRILGILLLIGFGMSLFFMVPALLGIITAGVAFLCVLPMMFVLIPLSFLAQMFMSLCIASSVADDLDVFSAVKRAWEITLKNFWPLALMSLLLYLVQMVAGLVISIPAWGAQMIFMIPLMSENADPKMIFTFFGIFMMIIMPLAFLIQGIAQTYVNSAWMLVYLDRTNPEISQSPETPVFVEPNA
jgi:hypothetical protein